MAVEFEIVWDIIPEVVLRVNAEARAAVKRTADNIARTMKDLAPVDTGDMRDSIESESVIGGYEAAVKIGEEYWIYPNYGTRYQAAQPFVEPAIDHHEAELAEGIMVALEGI